MTLRNQRDDEAPAQRGPHSDPATADAAEPGLAWTPILYSPCLLAITVGGT
ncbi:MAG TPA: hypothetical protein VMQ38_00500 [Mycobacterium sp.]|nr:hypothetical protein [Mycobacterium sp.]